MLSWVRYRRSALFDMSVGATIPLAEAQKSTSQSWSHDDGCIIKLSPEL
jgi:hypothetical protein